VHVCLSVYLPTRIFLVLQVQSSTDFLHVTSPEAVARSSSGGVTIRYALLVLWVTSCLHIMARNRRSKKASTHSDYCTDLTPRRILKVAHQKAAPYLRRV